MNLRELRAEVIRRANCSSPGDFVQLSREHARLMDRINALWTTRSINAELVADVDLATVLDADEVQAIFDEATALK